MHRPLVACAPSLLALLAVGCLAGGRAVAEDAPSFHLTLIGSFPGRAQAVAITSTGEVAVSGLISTTPPANTQADTWMSGTLSTLGDLGGGSAAPDAMNDAGTLVGVATTSDSEFHPALWSGGTVTDLSASLGADASPLAINNHGVVASWVMVPTPSAGLKVPNAATWSHGITMLLPTLNPGNPYSGAHCYSINDAGTVVGDSDGQAVEWIAGTPTSLGSFGIADFSGASAYAINASGTIACWAADTARHESLWVWSNGVATALPPLSSGYSPDYGLGRSLPLSINSAGDVVGQHYSARLAIVAVLWHHGHAYELDTCVAPGEGAGWSSLSVANAINDQGEIVGAGILNGQTCAFLLTPVASTSGTGTTGTTGATGAGTTGTASTTGTTGAQAGTGAAVAGTTGAGTGVSGSGSAGSCGLGGSAGLLALALAMHLQRLRTRARR